jgi:tetratricopeptide (TPR) repeat protein
MNPSQPSQPSQPRIGGAPSPGRSDEQRDCELVDRLRRAYLGEETGMLSLQDGDREELFLRKGRLFLDRDSALARQYSDLLGHLAGQQRPASDPRAQKAMAELAQHLRGGRRRPRPVAWETEIRGVEMIGPLPTILLLLEASTAGADEVQLKARLGGDSAQLERRDETPALKELPGLDDDMARAMVMVERPVRLVELLRGGDTGSVLRGLVRLWAVGLVATRARESVDRPSMVPARTLSRFLERIGEGLEDNPIELDPETHRAQLAELMAGQGQLDHYTLLGLERRADDAAISAAYNSLGRRAHPRHAQALGLEGKESTLELLFERATDAYLTLSDPHRRAEYNNLMGLHHQVVVGDSQREEEKRSMARQHYLRGSSALAEMDYSTAVDLLKEAARLDPKAEYWATLGKAQVKNPQWRRHAVGSFRNALELDPDNAGYQLALAKVYESVEQIDEAKEAYARTLELMPSNVDAQVGLDRLASGGGGEAPRQRGLRGVLGRRKD